VAHRLTSTGGGSGITGKSAAAAAAFGGVTGQLMLMLNLNHTNKQEYKSREILLTIVHSFKQFYKLQRRKQSKDVPVISATHRSKCHVTVTVTLSHHTSSNK